MRDAEHSEVWTWSNMTVCVMRGAEEEEEEETEYLVGRKDWAKC